jgi:hypothetical protein
MHSIYEFEYKIRTDYKIKFRKLSLDLSYNISYSDYIRVYYQIAFVHISILMNYLLVSMALQLL